MIFNNKDFELFKNWLDLDINSIAWEGRYTESFSEFWNCFFKDQINSVELRERFDHAKKMAKSGPLISWLNWLHDKFIVFTFIQLGKSVREISFMFSIPERTISTIIRDHLIKVFPVYEDFINENFQISNVSSDNLFLKFREIEPTLGSGARDKGTFEDDILANMEVTLYPEWPLLVRELKKDIVKLKLDFLQFQKKSGLKKRLRFFREVVVLLAITAIIIFAIKSTNKWYENYLVDKVTLFEPNFFWLDKSLSYQDQSELSKQQIDLSNQELEELEKLEAQSVFEDAKTGNRYDPESDVVILESVETVPKSFGEAEIERSDYEEIKKGGYRDTPYNLSNKKAYRVMITSVDSEGIRKNILDLMKKFGTNQVDNVKPGMQIPGGLYFNLYVPTKNLKEFLSNVSIMGESTIFESRSQGEDQPGKNKVFIWVKLI